MRTPNLISKLVSSFAVIILFLDILLSGYITSVIKDKINDTNYTISESLAFGHKISLIILLIIGLVLIGFLIHYRQQSKILTIIRLCLLVLIAVFFITIIWITTYKNDKQHYIFASIIFVSLVLLILINSYSLWNETLNKKLYQKIIILIVPILIGLSLIGLTTGFILLLDKDANSKAKRVFPSFELIIFSLSGLSILSLGFI